MLYYIIETLLLIGFTVTDAVNAVSASAVLKFTSIAVNTVMLLIILRKSQNKKPDKMAAALFLTLGADVFLILLDRCYLLGVLLFCMVQSLYGLELIFSDGEHPWKRVWGRLLVYGLVVGILRAGGMLDALTAASAYSMTQLTLNAVSGVCRYTKTKKKEDRWMALGLVLFWCCDACVGLRNATGYLPAFPQQISILAGYIIWWFYLPSQILLLQSERLKRNEE